MEIQLAKVNLEDSEPDYFFNTTDVRRCQKVEKWNELVVSALEVAESVDPYLPDVQVGTVIRAVDALNWKPGRNCDIRPKLLDRSTGCSRLLDSGSQISVAMKQPGDN